MVAFHRIACDALIALGEGDSVSLSGALTVGTWTDKTSSVYPNLNLQAYAVLTPYHVTRKPQSPQWLQARMAAVSNRVDGWTWCP